VLKDGLVVEDSLPFAAPSAELRQNG
jgi:hypothetical protein